MGQRSFLTKGELVTVSNVIYQEPENARKNLIASRFVDEFSNGIEIECEFPDGKYRRFINWPSIYAGHIKVKDSFGNEVRAVRE